MQIRREKLTRRQRSEIERIEQNARAKRHEWHEARRRGKLLESIIVIAICLLVWLVVALTPLGDMSLPWWAIAIPFGTLFFALGLYTLVLQLRAARWPATTCRIEFNDTVSERSRYLTHWFPVVSYVYEVDGREYTSDAVRIVSPDFTRAGAEAHAARYVPGTIRRCYINPADPEKAVLEQGIRYDISILFMAIGVGFPLLIYLSN